MMFCDLPIYLLRQYVFCPRIPFFILMREQRYVKPLWVQQGEYSHVRELFLSKRRSLDHFGIKGRFDWISNYSLSSRQLQLYGICDAVIQNRTNKEMFPIEIKHTIYLGKNAKIQLCAYMLVLSEMHQQEISKGFLVSSITRKVIPVQVTTEDKNRVLYIRNQIIQDCIRGRLPATSASEAQCSQCEYLNFCADRY